MEVHTIGEANTPRTVHKTMLQDGLVGRMLGLEEQLDLEIVATGLKKNWYSR